MCKDCSTRMRLIDRRPSKEHKLQSHNPYVYGGVEWSSTGIFLSSEDSHSLCVTANGAYPSDEYQLLTGEITAGLHLMIERLIYTFTEHTIFPVGHHVYRFFISLTSLLYRSWLSHSSVKKCGLYRFTTISLAATSSFALQSPSIFQPQDWKQLKRFLGG